MKIKILVPTYERLELTKLFVNSISIINSQYGNIEVVIIDDSESKNTLRFFHNNKMVTVLEGDGNLWWGGAINKGIDYINTLNIDDDDIIIFANNDVVIDIDNFKKLVEDVYQSHERLILHPKTFDQNNNFVSSGSKVICWFPYITSHKINQSDKYTEIDLGTARFLVMKFHEIIKNKGISHNLPQYQGDNDFTLRAKKSGAKINIHNDAFCYLDDENTGIKNTNITTLKDVFLSFKSIKSANNIRFRYNFLNNNFNAFYSLTILSSMTINVFVKYFIGKIKNA